MAGWKNIYKKHIKSKKNDYKDILSWISDNKVDDIFCNHLYIGSAYIKEFL